MRGARGGGAPETASCVSVKGYATRHAVAQLAATAGSKRALRARGVAARVAVVYDKVDCDRGCEDCTTAQ